MEKSGQSGDSLETIRSIFKNMGVALPGGDCKQISEILKTNNFMGWTACTPEKAQESANKGVAAICINDNSIAVVAAMDEEEPVSENTAVMFMSENTTNYTNENMAFYSYCNGKSTDCEQNAPAPHGNYLEFTCSQVAVCNDGIGASHGDKYHLNQTAYMNGVLNADIHRYIVVPMSVSGYANLLGCIGVAVRSNGDYVFGVVGDIGPAQNDENVLYEYSVKMVTDLGFETDGANYVSPAETVKTYIFTDTKRSSWPSSSFNEDAEVVGKAYFY